MKIFLAFRQSERILDLSSFCKRPIISKNFWIDLESTYLILSVTPLGMPTDTAAQTMLCSETFFSALHSTIELTVPSLQ